METLQTVKINFSSAYVTGAFGTGILVWPANEQGMRSMISERLSKYNLQTDGCKAIIYVSEKSQASELFVSCLKEFFQSGIVYWPISNCVRRSWLVENSVTF